MTKQLSDYQRKLFEARMLGAQQTLHPAWPIPMLLTRVHCSVRIALRLY